MLTAASDMLRNWTNPKMIKVAEINKCVIFKTMLY